MKTAMFADETARARIAEWFTRFRDALPFPTESRELDTPAGRTHVLVAGPKDAPPLVCLHGALASSAHLLPELGALVESHRVYAVDVIGQSVMSEDRRIAVDDDAYGQWFVDVCKGLGLAKVTLFGVSWGGFVSHRAAKVAPELIDALVLLAPAGVVGAPAWAGFKKVGWPMLCLRLFPSEARLRKVFDALFSTHDDTWMAYFGDALTSYRLDMRIPPAARPEEFSGYKGPVLVMAAGDDVSFPGAALLARAKELFPQAETALFADAKHSPPMTAAFRAENAARIARFLQKHRAAPAVALEAAV